MADRPGERCEVCDKPVATDEEWSSVPEGERDDLCWGIGANCVEADWRERALEAVRCLSVYEQALRQIAEITPDAAFKNAEAQVRNAARLARAALTTDFERLRAVLDEVSPTKREE